MEPIEWEEIIEPTYVFEVPQVSDEERTRIVLTNVEGVTRGLVAAGVSKDEITGNVSEDGRTMIVARQQLPNRQLVFGLFGIDTVNAFENGKDKGLCDVNGGIRWLQGRWYNENE